MEAIEFVKKLETIPSKDKVERLRKKGLSEEFIIEYLNNFRFSPKQTRKNSGNPLKDLVLNYDGIGVQIGMINFEIEPFEDYSHYYFGRFEADYLAINKNLQTIELLEYGTENHILCECAASSSQFLDAIFEGARYLDEPSFYDNPDSDQRIICQAAQHCSELAGGNKYLGFYQLLLGCFE
jgi:hypothetical protein